MKFTFFRRYPYIGQILLALGLGIGFYLLTTFLDWQNYGNIFNFLASVFFTGGLFGIFLFYPLILLVDHGILLVKTFNHQERRKSPIYNIWTILLSLAYQIIYLVGLKEVYFDKAWQEQLYNRQLHAPIFQGSYLGIILLAFIFFLALIILQYKNVNNLPPLLTVLSMSAILLGTLYLLLWTFHIARLENILDFYLLIPAFPLVIIVIRILYTQVHAYVPDPNRRSKIDSIPILAKLNDFLKNVKTWPWMAILFMLPILVFIVIILVLFGQAPDSLIKAFTETSDWNLSTKEAPQNIYYDEHYLCTVAAGGHKEIVKPIRKGIRHGHAVTVNRQLQIANAFEQILEEKTPRLHGFVRGLYDKYGFPIARLNHSKWVADIIWFIMKPLELVFLVFIYLVDVHPEDRIAIQYTGKKKEDFLVF